MDTRTPNAYADPRELILPGQPGWGVVKRGAYLYVCDICGTKVRYPDEYGPACTGPGATDQHPMEPMRLVEWLVTLS